MPSLRDALRDGRDSQGQGLQDRDVQKDHSADRFSSGAEWVRVVLVPAIERGNVELQPERVASGSILISIRRSTNHAHADFWLSETGEGHCATGPKYSINIIDGQSVRLYKPGEPGRDLGDVAQCGPEAIGELLREAAEEFGRLIGRM